MASFGAMSFTLSKHQGSLNRSRTVQQNNELMEALSPSQSDQSLNLVIGSRSIIPTIQAATELIQFTFSRDDPESTSTQATPGAHTTQTRLKHLKALIKQSELHRIPVRNSTNDTWIDTTPKGICSNCYAITFTSFSARLSLTQVMERGPELASRNPS